MDAVFLEMEQRKKITADMTEADFLEAAGTEAGTPWEKNEVLYAVLAEMQAA
jgi:hypothetical protein